MSFFRSLFGSRDPFSFDTEDTDQTATLVGLHTITHTRGHDGNDMPVGARGNELLNGHVATDTSRDDQDQHAPIAGGAINSASHASVTSEATVDIAVTSNASHVPATSDATVDVANGGGTGNAPGNTTSGVWNGGNGGIHDPTLMFYIEGTDQADTLYGSHYADEMHGLGGNDTLLASWSNDFLYGEEGNDTLDGGGGNDVLDGGIGNDTLRGGQGADTLIGGEGMDNVSYVLASTGVMLDLATGGITNDAAGDTYSGIENVFGTSYGDIINGNAQGNVIHGGSGDDYVFGQGGDDRLFGDMGIDTLRGGAGNDMLNGGMGRDRLTGDDAGQFGYDTFVMRPGYGADTVTDFQRGYDRIDLSAYGITHLGSDGVLAVGPTSTATWFLGGLDHNERLVFDRYDHTLYQVTVAYSNADEDYYVSSRSAIVTLQGVDDLSGSDLILA